MKLKLCAAVMAVSGMLFSPMGSATPACSSLATVSAWAAAGSCVDQDNDLLLTFISSSAFPLNAVFNVTETEIGNVDLYDISFNWDTVWAGGGTIKYGLTSLDPSELLAGANFDTIVQGAGALATKQLFDIDSVTPFLTLTSVNGTRDPAQGETSFNPRTSLIVVDTYNDSGTSVFFHSDNSFKVVPEPGSLALVGLGLVGLVLLRKRVG